MAGETRAGLHRSGDRLMKRTTLKLERILEILGISIKDLPWRKTVLDKDLSAPPGAPSDGDRYIVDTGGSGAWNGQDGNIAEWSDAANAWEFTTPELGWFVFTTDDEELLYWEGAAWDQFDLDDLGDVTISGLADNDFLMYDTGTTQWLNIDIATASALIAAAIDLNDLADVVITGTPADNELLAWDTGSATWINQTATEAGLAALSHSHVWDSDLTATATNNYLRGDGAGGTEERTPGQVLTDIGGAAVVHAHALDDLTDVVITGTPADNEVLAWNTGTSRWINQTATEAGLAAASHTHVWYTDLVATAANNYLRGDGAGGTEERTPGQVLTDIGGGIGLSDVNFTAVNTPSASAPVSWAGEITDISARHSGGAPTRITTIVGDNFVRIVAQARWSTNNTEWMRLYRDGALLSPDNGGFDVQIDATASSYTSLNATSGVIAVGVPGTTYFTIVTSGTATWASGFFSLERVG